mmetsp:Transcript_35168/g.58944  ORF Transcript_35168/g.58944 Transcript_35168/m.58944 type:complete len:110 (+) Transcript_35168:3-332(+)
MACCTRCSDSASRALVASSSTRMEGSRSSVRAMATRCFCPPDSLPPSLPTSVMYPSGEFTMKSWALAFLHAASSSSSVNPRPCSPSVRFSSNVPRISRGIWLTALTQDP